MCIIVRYTNRKPLTLGEVLLYDVKKPHKGAFLG